MRTFPSEEALVAAYWRKLARSIEVIHKNREALRRHAPSRKSSRARTARRRSQLGARPRARFGSNME
jgi:uncharacterized protein (DUF2236 family)